MVLRVWFLPRGGGPAEEEADPELQEFLEAMQPRRKAAIWSNDTGATAADAGGKGRPGPEGMPGTGKKARAKAAAAAAGVDGNSSDDEYTDLPATRSVPSGAKCLCLHPVSYSPQQSTLDPFHVMAKGFSTWII